MSIRDFYPADYRSKEFQALLSAVRAGECVSIVGLSGAGKSNLLGFLAHRLATEIVAPRFVMVDCNRLARLGPAAFFHLVRRTLREADEVDVDLNDELGPPVAEWSALEGTVAHFFTKINSLCLLFDRFDVLAQPAAQVIYSNLRALRDMHKYSLTYVTATRRPLDPNTEFAELFYANTIWLGPLSPGDARWNVLRYAERKGLHWGETTIQGLIAISWGYPSLLRAACEAYADLEIRQAGSSGEATLSDQVLVSHPAVQRRAAEFWADEPDDEALRRSGLEGQPLLMIGHISKASSQVVEDSQLTAKEHLLLVYLQVHPGVVCDKDNLIRAVWPEDRIYEAGIRDDSLAQLIRRLRKKIEKDPDKPDHIHTVPGRGYRYIP